MYQDLPILYLTQPDILLSIQFGFKCQLQLAKLISHSTIWKTLIYNAVFGIRERDLSINGASTIGSKH